MIPPLPPTLAESAPQFASLHKTLTSSYLSSDASSRALNTTSSHKQTDQALRAHRVVHAKRHILLSVLFSLPTHNNDPPLPSPLPNLIHLVTALISHPQQLSDDDADLLDPEIASFRAHLPTLTALLSQRLTQLEADLAAAAAVTSADLLPSDFHHPHNSVGNREDDVKGSLSAHLQSQTTYLRGLQTEVLPELLVETTNALTSSLRRQAREIEGMVSWLETRKHGAEARYVLGRAAFGEQVAKTLAGKVGVAVAEMERDLDFDVAGGNDGGGVVRRQLDGVRKERDQVEARRREVEGALAEYAEVERGVRGNGMVMRRLGMRYGEVEREVSEVREDVERLIRRVDGVGAEAAGHEDEDETLIR